MWVAAGCTPPKPLFAAVRCGVEPLRFADERAASASIRPHSASPLPFPVTGAASPPSSPAISARAVVPLGAGWSPGLGSCVVAPGVRRVAVVGPRWCTDASSSLRTPSAPVLRAERTEDLVCATAQALRESTEVSAVPLELVSATWQPSRAQAVVVVSSPGRRSISEAVTAGERGAAEVAATVEAAVEAKTVALHGLLEELKSEISNHAANLASLKLELRAAGGACAGDVKLRGDVRELLRTLAAVCKDVQDLQKQQVGHQSRMEEFRSTSRRASPSNEDQLTRKVIADQVAVLWDLHKGGRPIEDDSLLISESSSSEQSRSMREVYQVVDVGKGLDELRRRVALQGAALQALQEGESAAAEALRTEIKHIQDLCEAVRTDMPRDLLGELRRQLQGEADAELTKRLTAAVEEERRRANVALEAMRSEFNRELRSLSGCLHETVAGVSELHMKLAKLSEECIGYHQHHQEFVADSSFQKKAQIDITHRLQVERDGIMEAVQRHSADASEALRREWQAHALDPPRAPSGSRVAPRPTASSPRTVALGPRVGRAMAAVGPRLGRTATSEDRQFSAEPPGALPLSRRAVLPQSANPKVERRRSPFSPRAL